tara:strand:+ start:565 stop:753 length:189 start_codon:yes stop_codon:yes gene_type:complete
MIPCRVEPLELQAMNQQPYTLRRNSRGWVFSRPALTALGDRMYHYAIAQWLKKRAGFQSGRR